MALLVPLVQKYCSCTDQFYNPTLLAYRQKEFEELRLSGLTNFQALEKMNIKRLCCRESLFNPATLFLNSENVDRVRDDINKFKIVEKNTREILPTKTVPSLP